MFVSDLLAVSAQIACVSAVATIIALIVRIDAASVRYHYWRCVLVLCLLLPWLQRRQAPAAVVEAIPSIGFLPTGIDTYPIVSVPSAHAGPPWITLVVWTIVGGIALRLARIGIGLVQLQRFRRSGSRVPPNPEHAELQWALGTDAEIRYVREGHPITCGAWRPVVLLPMSLLKHPVLVQQAVLVHELLHVQRRDWIWVMAEEIVRSILWFHPAVWWLVSRIRRAREEVVDELTVLATHHRRAYLEALLAFADAAPFASAAFARRTHLFHRMMLISKEAVMSSKRVVASCAVLACAVITGSWYAVGAFPMQAAQPQAQAPGAVQPAAQAQPSRAGGPGPLERGAKPITPENPIPRRTYSVMPQYPGDTDQGAVVLTLRVTVNALGRVAEVRSMSGAVGGRGVARGVAPGGRATNAPGTFNQAFAKAATDAVRQWIYDPPADPPIAFDVTLAFAPGTEARLLAHGGQVALAAPGGRVGSGGGGVVGGIPGGVLGGVVGGLADAPPPPPPRRRRPAGRKGRFESEATSLRRRKRST
jgi:beta-lactamase regulating signal transducer with metallopeptidase domain